MSGMLLRLVCTAALAAGTVLAPASASAVPEPGVGAGGSEGRSVAELLTELQTLYREAGKATESYNATTGGGTCYAGERNQVADPCGWKYSAGLGLSWESPLGPLQLSYGRPINEKEGDEKQSFQFQIGTAF